MTGDNTLLLVVARCVTRKLENLSCKVFEDGSEVDWGTGTDSLGVVSLLQQSVDSTNGDWA